MGLLATEVFVPGSFPVHTYVERTSERLEQALRDALETPGQVVSLSGPSKSGKTVLVERVAGRDFLIPVSGAGLDSADEIWDRVLDWMDLPQTTTRQRSLQGSASLEGSAAGGATIPLVAKGELRMTAGGEVSRSSERGEDRARRGMAQVLDEIGKSEFVVLVDDFHYMPRAVQVGAAKVLKEAVRLGLKVVTAAVSHRGDDVVRANPELRGRVRAVDLDYWPGEELAQIAKSGFEALNASIPENEIDTMVAEAAGSPQLMQLICLQACFVLDLREKSVLPKRLEIDSGTFTAILGQASSATDFRSLVDVLDGGPMTRGTERKMYSFHDGTQGDVYRCVLKAIASDPPRLSLKYSELMERAAAICTSEAPVGSSVTSACVQMAKLAKEKFPLERVIDWDEEKQTLDIPDPYLLFYLRWSGRLREA